MRNGKAALRAAKATRDDGYKAWCVKSAQHAFGNNQLIFHEPFSSAEEASLETDSLLVEGKEEEL